MKDLQSHYHILSVLTLLVVLISCSSSKPEKNIIKSTQPSSHTIYKSGDRVVFSFKSNVKHDSAMLLIDGVEPMKVEKQKTWSYLLPKSQMIGDNRYTIVVYRDGHRYERDGVFKVHPKSKPHYTKLELQREFNHSRKSYTQGLEFYDGKLYESSGEYGKSFLQMMEFPSMKVVKRVDLEAAYFAEGVTILNDKLYMLTWKENVVLVYDAKTLEKIDQMSYPTEGWGLTNDGVNLYMTDGTSSIFVVDPSTFKTIRQFEVLTDKGAVGNINELEWIDGKIWANVYGYESVLIIDPTTGEVETIADANHLLSPKERDATTDVFNGIAKDHKTGKIYVTGKNWSKLFEIEVGDDK